MTSHQVVAKAREYLGTPLHHQGRAKGKRIDCVGLILCVAEDLGLQDKNGIPLRRTDHLNYGPQPHGNLVHETTKQRLPMKWEAAEKTPMPEIAPGDVITLLNPSVACHAGIVSTVNDSLAIIHAYPVGPARPRLRKTRQCVVEHMLTPEWRARIAGIFFFPGVSD